MLLATGSFGLYRTSSSRLTFGDLVASAINKLNVVPSLIDILHWQIVKSLQYRNSKSSAVP